MILKASKVIFALGAIFAASSSAMASGYGVKLQSGWTAGMANAGSGVTDDALAIYANPAAMIQNNTHQMAGSMTGVFGNTKFKGKASTGEASTIGSIIPGVGGVPGVFSETGKTRNASKKVAIPSFGIVANTHDCLKLGLMVHAPFGLKFNYGHHSLTRGHSTRAEMTSVNVLPSFALKIVDWLSFGAGLQMQYSKVVLARKAFLAAPNAPLNFNDWYSHISGTDWTMGWTAGLFGQITKDWKLGLSYKSKMVSDIDGYGKLHTLAGVEPIPRFQGSAKLYYPQIFTLSTSYDLTNRWTAYMDVIYTKWDIVKDITISTYPMTGPTSDVIPLRWKNSWFASVGANYKWDDNWSFRGGYAFDKSPTRTSTHVVSIPDSNKHWVAVGATYNMASNLSLTLSYGHEFFKDGKVNLSQGSVPPGSVSTFNKGDLVGKIKNRLDFVSAQFNYRF